MIDRLLFFDHWVREGYFYDRRNNQYLKHGAFCIYLDVEPKYEFVDVFPRSAIFQIYTFSKKDIKKYLTKVRGDKLTILKTRISLLNLEK